MQQARFSSSHKEVLMLEKCAKYIDGVLHKVALAVVEAQGATTKYQKTALVGAIAPCFIKC